MDLMEIMQKRYSCRKFTDEKVSQDDLDLILEAGRIAPSAINRQPWRFLVLNDDEALAKVDECSKCRYGAQTVILVSFNIDESAKNPVVTPDYGWIDSGLAIMQMALEIENLGLGSCIVGAYDPETTREVFNMPSNLIPYQFVMIGHPEAGPSKAHETRRPLDEIVEYGSY